MANRIKHSLLVEIGSVVHEFSSAQKRAKAKQKSTKAAVGHIFVLGKEDRHLLKSLIEKHAPAWQAPGMLTQIQRELIHFAGVNGPVWIFCKKKKAVHSSHYGRLDDTDFSWHRDQAGGIFGFAKAYGLSDLRIEFNATEESQEFGFLTGLELSSYSFKNAISETAFMDTPKVEIVKIGGALSSGTMTKAANLGVATNWARHLVNAPPNELNPSTLAAFSQKHFAKAKKFKLEIWNAAKLKREGMGLHYGVGQGSEHPPCLLILKYRGKGGNLKAKPISFVGKGVTFDTGGLDIKPSSGMRLMKKDMGGVAALLGLAFWLKSSQPSIDIDIFLGLAENSVDAKSMRPSDVLRSRNGMSVEIHNTDAEGRLVLADALDVAVTQSEEPSAVIDVATLTGAIKVGLGGDIAGLFSNHDELAEELNLAGAQAGEPNWRMPLFPKYTKGMESSFADIVNCIDGFGGAITAALFLEKFVKQKPWAHLDIYGWNDKPSGALGFAGGNGQPVQTLVQFLENRIRS